jgi:hypothetical protein
VFDKMIEMDDNLEELIYSENVIGFTTLATEYCNMLDEVVLMSQKDFIDKLHRLLPLIYLKAIILPDLQPEMPEMIDKVVTQEEWDAVNTTLSNKLQKINNYTENLDSLNDEQQMTSLSEGMSDIYQDLKDFVSLYNMGTPDIMNDAIWDCKKNFKEFWGQRLVNITRVLHNLLYGNYTLDENDALTDKDFDPETWEKNNYDDE